MTGPAFCSHSGSPDLHRQQATIGSRLVDVVTCGDCETWAVPPKEIDMHPGTRVRLVKDAPPMDGWPETAVGYEIVWLMDSHDDAGTVITSSPDDDGCVLVIWDGMASDPPDYNDGFPDDGFPAVTAWRLPAACLVDLSETPASP